MSQERRIFPLRMEPEALLDISAIAHELSGFALHELAVRKPRAAYTILRLAQIAYARRAGRVIDRDVLVASTPVDGQDNTTEVAIKLIDSLMPEVPAEPMKITVYTFATTAEDGTPLERTRHRQSTEVLSFDVDPPWATE